MSEENDLKQGFIVPCLTAFFDLVGHLFPMRGRLWSAGAVEGYVLICLSTELLFLGLLFGFPSWSDSPIFVITVTTLVSLRLLDIVQAAYRWLIVAPIRRLEIISTPRLLILSLINYVELSVVFGVIAFLTRKGFNPEFQSVWHSFYYSISVITALGTSVEPVTTISRVIFLSEIVLGLLFLLLIIARAVSILPHTDTKR